MRRLRDLLVQSCGACGVRVFETGSSFDPVTTGVDVAAKRLPTGGSLILADCPVLGWFEMKENIEKLLNRATRHFKFGPWTLLFDPFWQYQPSQVKVLSTFVGLL